MKSERILRHFALAFALALIGYFGSYHAIEHRRTRKGPWEVTFTASARGNALLIINQPVLGITNARIAFVNTRTSLTATGHFAFSKPQPVPYSLPFGRCVFMDTTFLPGTVSMEMYGREIELLPRVLLIDRKEWQWRPGMQIELTVVP